jgi:hypothetical protein
MKISCWTLAGGGPVDFRTNNVPLSTLQVFQNIDGAAAVATDRGSWQIGQIAAGNLKNVYRQAFSFAHVCMLIYSLII